jgi:hypothetical protein
VKSFYWLIDGFAVLLGRENSGTQGTVVIPEVFIGNPRVLNDWVPDNDSANGGPYTFQSLFLITQFEFVMQKPHSPRGFVFGNKTRNGHGGVGHLIDVDSLTGERLENRCHDTRNIPMPARYD